MKIKLRKLRELIYEARFRAWRWSGAQGRFGDPIELDAGDSIEAGRFAARELSRRDNVRLDPSGFSGLDIEEINDDATPTKTGSFLVPVKFDTVQPFHLETIEDALEDHGLASVWRHTLIVFDPEHWTPRTMGTSSIAYFLDARFYPVSEDAKKIVDATPSPADFVYWYQDEINRYGTHWAAIGVGPGDALGFAKSYHQHYEELRWKAIQIGNSVGITLDD